jgi:hypothetical protein
MPGSRFVYVDESKVPPFSVAASIVSAHDVGTVRHTLCQLLLTNQKRLHFKSEKDQRRRTHLQTMARLPVSVWLYRAEATSGGEIRKRSACLTALIEDLAGQDGDVRLYIENDQSVVRHDRATIYAALAKQAAYDQISYCHVAAKDEPGLWISDAVAWCWPKGGTWRKLAEPLVTRQTSV